MMLGDLGADVVKVERPGEGDGSRRWGPPFEGGESAYFMQVNRNKRSIAVDLRDDAGREVVRRLIGRCDVLLHNFLPAAALRYEVDWEAVRAVNPMVVHCTIAGYPSDGPDAERPGYDFLMQGLGGIMSITGDVGGPPMRVGIAIADITAGMFAAYAVQVALYHRERTGVGQMIDTSLLDGQLAMMTYQAGRYFATGEAPPSSGSQHPTIVPYGVYRASDAYFNLAVGTEDLWRRFCAALELEPLRADPRFTTNRDRLAHRDELNALLEPLFAGHTINQIQELMDQASVPCGAVRDLHAVFTDPQVAALGLIESLDHPTAGGIKVVGPPYRFSETPPSVRLPPPLLGQHTDEVLRELAYDDATIVALHEARVVA